MKSKIFLFFSCLVFLMSVIYFAFVTIRGRTNAASQQASSKMLAKLNEDLYDGRVAAPKPRHDEFSAFTDAELEAAIELLDAMDTESNSEEIPLIQDLQLATSEIGMFEEQDAASGTGSRLEATFEFYKGNLARHWEIAHETNPLMNKIVELDESMDELSNHMIENSN